MVANANELETLENFAIYDSSNQYANGGSGWALEGAGDFDRNGLNHLLWRHQDGRIGQFAMQESGEAAWQMVGFSGADWDVIL